MDPRQRNRIVKEATYLVVVVLVIGVATWYYYGRNKKPAPTSTNIPSIQTTFNTDALNGTSTVPGIEQRDSNYSTITPDDLNKTDPFAQ